MIAFGETRVFLRKHFYREPEEKGILIWSIREHLSASTPLWWGEKLRGQACMFLMAAVFSISDTWFLWGWRCLPSTNKGAIDKKRLENTKCL